MAENNRAAIAAYYNFLGEGLISPEDLDAIAEQFGEEAARAALGMIPSPDGQEGVDQEPGNNKR